MRGRLREQSRFVSVYPSLLSPHSSDYDVIVASKWMDGISAWELLGKLHHGYYDAVQWAMSDSGEWELNYLLVDQSRRLQFISIISTQPCRHGHVRISYFRHSISRPA